MRVTRRVDAESRRVWVTGTDGLLDATHARVQRTGEIVAIERLTPKTVVVAERAAERSAAQPLIAGDVLEPIVQFTPGGDE